MPLDKKPFVAYTLDDEKQNKKHTDVFTVRLNPEERAKLEQIKEDLNIKSDGKALKIAAWCGINVLHGTFSRPILRYLTNKERLKLSDFKNF